MARIASSLSAPPWHLAWLGVAALSAGAAVGTTGFTATIMVADAVAIVALTGVVRRRRSVGDARGEQVATVQAAAGAEPISFRGAVAHPVSGLPMREALVARMRADRVGVLGAIFLTDFDRLTAFDPALGDRVFTAIVDRLRAMLPAQRLVAQVDRGKIGLWFAGDASEGARAEMDAIGYALGDTIDAGGTRIVPEIKLRLARFDAAGTVEPGTFLARTLASFSLPEDAAATPAPMAEYAELARERYALEQDLRQAVARRELSLAFQPLIDAGQGCVSGAEALVRWDHGRLGPVPPARFVPIMESTGLAGEIGLWVLNAALREAGGWAAQGLSQLRVAVNVSGLQLEGDDLPVLVQRTLHRHELPATALEIELTESVATSDAAHCRRIFDRLRALGVKLAVDDFGTGYSGFSSLRTLAFDKIKIDREFVTQVDLRRDSQAICQSIIALGRGLGIRVLAEGVERREEFEWLRRHGCQHFQGYYFAAPLTPEAFRRFARDTAGLGALLRSSGAPASIEERLKA